MVKLKTYVLAATNEWTILMLKMLEQIHTNSEVIFPFFGSAALNH